MTYPSILVLFTLAGCPSSLVSVVAVTSPPTPPTVVSNVIPTDTASPLPTPIGRLGGGRLVGESGDAFGFALAASDIDCDGDNDLVASTHNGARVYNGVIATATQPWLEAWLWPFEIRNIHPGPDVDDDGCPELLIDGKLLRVGSNPPPLVTLHDELPIFTAYGFGDYNGDGRDDIWSGQGPRFGPAPYPEQPPWTLSETMDVELVINAQQQRMLLAGGLGRIGPVMFHQPSPPQQRADIPLAELVEHTWPFVGGEYGFSVVEVNDQPGDELAINTLDRVLVYPTSGPDLNTTLVEWSFAEADGVVARMPVFADFNGDGFTDAFLIPVDQPPWMGLVYLGPLTGQLTLDDADLRFYGDPTTPSRAAAHVSMDFDHDGRADLVIGDSGDGPVVGEALPPGKVYLLTWDDLAPHLVAPP